MNDDALRHGKPQTTQQQQPAIKQLMDNTLDDQRQHKMRESF